MSEDRESLENRFRLGDDSVIPDLITLWRETGTGPFSGNAEPPTLIVTLHPEELARVSGRIDYARGTLRIDFLSNREIRFAGLIPSSEEHRDRYFIDFRGEGRLEIPPHYAGAGHRVRNWYLRNFDIVLSPENLDLPFTETHHLEVTIRRIIRNSIAANPKYLVQAQSYALQASIIKNLEELARTERVMTALKREIHRNLNNYFNIPQSPKPVLEVTFDPDGNQGWYQVRLAADPRIHGTGATIPAAIRDILVTLKSFGYSDLELDYEIQTNLE